MSRKRVWLSQKVWGGGWGVTPCPLFHGCPTTVLRLGKPGHLQPVLDVPFTHAQVDAQCELEYVCV